MKKISFLLLTCCLFCLPVFSAALAEDAKPLADTPLKLTQRNTPVSVEHSGTDDLGAKLSTRVKERLNGSNLFLLEEKDVPKFRILLSTTPEFESRPNFGSAYAVVWVFSLSDSTLRHFLMRDVGVMTAEEVDGVAAKIIEQTDQLAVRYGYLFPEKPQQ